MKRVFNEVSDEKCFLWAEQILGGERDEHLFFRFKWKRTLHFQVVCKLKSHLLLVKRYTTLRTAVKAELLIDSASSEWDLYHGHLLISVSMFFTRLTQDAQSITITEHKEGLVVMEREKNKLTFIVRRERKYFGVAHDANGPSYLVILCVALHFHLAHCFLWSLVYLIGWILLSCATGSPTRVRCNWLLMLFSVLMLMLMLLLLLLLQLLLLPRRERVNS